MKKKTFILTLMMLLCSFVYGQDYHWTVNGDNGDYASNFTIDAVIQLDGVLQNRSNLELGVFYGDECRTTTMTTDLGTGQYIAELFVFGEFGQIFTLKLYDHATGKTYSDNYIIKFEDNTITDLLIPYIEDYQYGEIFNPAVINFKTPNYYTPDTSGDDGNMSLTSVIFIDGVEQHDSNLELGAFCGDVVKGSAKANMVDTNFGITRNYAKMVIGGNSGNVITFRLYDHASGKELEFVDVNTINYTTNASLGTILDPFVVNFITSPYVAQIGETKYQSIQAAVNAATAGQTVTIIANVSDEAVQVNKNITITDNGEFILNNVSINAVEDASSLTVSNLSFTGNSWINSGAASELVVSGVTADVTPSNASVTNSRSAFISLGCSEQKTLELTVENSSIIARGGSDAILGWAAITEANITGNTFGSASAYQTNSDCVKFMAIADGAVLNITNNNVYSNYNGIVFGQNTTRNNAYTANVSGNNFYGGADHIWIEVSGSNTCHATINATSTNKVNGNAFTANDIKTHPNITTWTSYGGVDVVFNNNNKIIGGTFKYIADSLIAEGYEKAANTDGTYSIVKSISGKIAYRAYVNDTETREGVQVDLLNIIAKQSVVVKLYDANGNILTTTSLKAGAAEAANLTCNIVLWGNPSSSWETTKHTALTVANVPAKIELLIDGTLKDTFVNALGAGTNVDETAEYLALDCVYKEAKINNTYYATLEAAIAAAKTGDTIVLLADVTLANVETTSVTLPENVTLDLNGKTVKADIIGTVKTNGGLWITSTGHKMLGSGADIYATENATVINSANEVNIVSGAITLATTEWWTLQNQNLTIGSGATFTIPATSKFNVMNGTTVTVNGTAINNGTLAIYGTAIVNGTFTATGTVELADVNATLKAQAGLNVITNIADYKVVYENNMYKVVAKVYVAQVGTTKYETLEEAIAAAQSGETIVLLANIETANVTLPTDVTLDLNGKTVKADIIGTVKTNGGLWITSTGHKMLGSGADIYATENATVINSANEVNIVSGAITLATTEWWTLQNQNLTIGSGATFTIPATSKFNVMNGTTVTVNGTAINNGTLAIYGTAIVNGTFTATGTVELADVNATLKAQAGLNVITNIADYKVVYENNMYKVVAKVYVAQVGSTKYETLAEAIAAVPANQTITVLKDITLAETLTIAAEKNFTLDLNGKAINAGYQQNSTDKHIYAFDNKGSLTLANGTINARGIFNYGTLTVNATATINSIDANGGYGVDNYGTLNVYGKIATTYEDGDAPESGNYDATPVKNEANATANVFNGSVIANVSNFTYGIENNGTLNITGGTISSKHSTIGNYGAMTVEGGTIICDGYEGVSSQVIVAWNGSTTNIKGGTFNGKDNNNGFNVDAEAGAKVYISGGNFLSCYSGSLYGAGTIEVSGGKFFDAVPENRCAEGYIPTQFTDGTYGVKPGSYIAQIGTTKYETFEAAYTAAKTGDVVVLFRTVVITNSKPWINYSKKNITVKAEFGETAFRVQDGAYVWFGGMTIESNDYCIIVGASDSSSGATVELYGGTYYGATSAVSVTKGDVKIMDGTFKVEPYQGSYEYTINCIDANYNQTAKVSIQGGKFYKFNPMNNAAEGVGTNFVVANHITVKDTDNYWTVVALPTTDKIVSSADHTVTSNGYGPATVTVTGEVPCVANGQGIVSSWIGFRITKPEGVDANVARVFTPGSNGTYNEKTLASILDEGKDYASMWVSIQYKRVFDYKVDWNNDGIMDLVINIDATAATIKHNYVEVERVEPSYGQDGYIKYQCGCGAEYIETLPAEKVAQIGETKYTTIEAAAEAAQSGQTIVVLADVETTNVALPTDVTLDLNGKTVKADIIGKISINNGLWVTKEGYKMIGNGAEYYQTTDATIVMGTKYSIEMLSGTVNLVPAQWYTLEGQNITIKQGATFNISAGQTFVINGSTVENNGTVNNAGTVQILAGTVKGNITGNLHFKGGNYITADNHNMVGTTSDYHYNATDALVNIATNGDITIAAGAMTLGHNWRTLPGQTVTVAQGATFTVPTGMTYQIYGTAIVNGTITVNGTVELAALEATLKAQAGLNVITNITDYKVVYADGMYKVVQAIYEQRRTLGAGWNWFSSYINISGEEGLQALETALGTSGLQIKGQLGFVDYSTGWGWNGTLVSASVEEMYMIQTSAQVELVLTGELANPATPITLQKNWTYIGYPVSEPMNLEDALANITPNDGDIIKTHNGGVAQYYAAYNGWYTQSLQSMTPGMGYMYRNTSGTTKTLVYPTPNAQTRAEVRANVTTENNHWAPNASAFANNMNIIAVLENNDMMGEFEVAAFVNGEVRGSARPTYVEPIDAYVLFMTIYGEEGEEMTFKYYDIYSDEEHSINNTVTYSDDAVIGSIIEPYMFFANTLGLGENAASTLSIYPNPTTTNTAISFETTFDMVEVFNSLGAKVAEYRNVDRIEGVEAAGVYVIRVTNDSAVQNCRLIVK